MSKKVVPVNPCADYDQTDCLLNTDWDGSEGETKRVLESP